jgi:hypothetical protein
VKSSLTSRATAVKSSPPSIRSRASCAVGQRLDEDQAGAYPLGQGQPLGDAGVELLVADRDPELLRPRLERGGVDQRARRIVGEAVEAQAQAVDLLLDDLVPRAAELRLQLGDLGDRLRGQDSLALRQVGPVVRDAGDRGHRPEVRLPVAVPCRCAEDTDGERDRHRERDDDELLRAQLILPAWSVPAVEDRAGSEAHRLMVMRRLGIAAVGAAAAGRAPC